MRVLLVLLVIFPLLSAAAALLMAVNYLTENKTTAWIAFLALGCGLAGQTVISIDRLRKEW